MILGTEILVDILLRAGSGYTVIVGAGIFCYAVIADDEI